MRVAADGYLLKAFDPRVGKVEQARFVQRVRGEAVPGPTAQDPLRPESAMRAFVFQIAARAKGSG
jgi:hypothetical protein